jgi:hypothetical protein
MVDLRGLYIVSGKRWGSINWRQECRISNSSLFLWK